MNLQKLSKEMSYALRHAPHEYGLTLDARGFAPVEALLAGINRVSGAGEYGREVTLEDLHRAMEASDKRRHEIVGDQIRALYGHSTPERVEMQPGQPPAVLYHGTSREALPSIMAEGLCRMSRQYVHLAPDEATARRVGARHDAEPVLLRVDAAAAAAAGVVFYIGGEKTWLADAVPPQFIE